VSLLAFIARVLGFTFAIKLMEAAEEASQKNYVSILAQLPEAAAILAQEEQHEQFLLGMLDEERLHYVGSVVLGLNDALVELSGALAGFTLALQNTRLIALAGLITGISAEISVAASEYLSTRSEGGGRRPGRAALYTGVAYILTVGLMIAPYLLLKNYFLALVVTLAVAVLIIAGFNFYISVARGESFRRRFFEMVGLSLGVALLSFGIGYLVRQVLGIKI
jgi:VIT1/CCC1 family predicted Fe2+/Mn2+ transporter